MKILYYIKHVFNSSRKWFRNRPVLVIVMLLAIVFGASFSRVVDGVEDAVQNHRINNYKVQEYERVKVYPPGKKNIIDESGAVEKNLERKFEPSAGMSEEQEKEVLDLLSETGFESVEVDE